MKLTGSTTDMASARFTEIREIKQVFNPFPHKPWFLRVCGTSLLKTLPKKEKLLVTSNFSFSRSVFYPFEELSSTFIKFEIVVYKLMLSVWKSLKFVVWKRVKLSKYLQVS